MPTPSSHARNLPAKTYTRAQSLQSGNNSLAGFTFLHFSVLSLYVQTLSLTQPQPSNSNAGAWFGRAIALITFKSVAIRSPFHQFFHTKQRRFQALHSQNRIIMKTTILFCVSLCHRRFGQVGQSASAILLHHYHD